MAEIKIQTFKGQQILPYIDDLAKLRIDVFREYPYLYDGTPDYEKKYLETYTSSSESIMVIAFDDTKVVGASTAIPLEFEVEAFKQPFIESDLDVSKIFYLGESVLLPEYRGKKIYRHFFSERESAALKYGSFMTAFCAVERSQDDPRQSATFRPLNEVWKHFGYHKTALSAKLAWKEIGNEHETTNTLIFGLKIYDTHRCRPISN